MDRTIAARLGRVWLADGKPAGSCWRCAEGRRSRAGF